MPRLRGTKYLTCFYCGKRSNIKYNNHIDEFLCLYCDATNYLDENGEITDPPVATEREAPATQYATSRQSISISQPNNSIFCSTCLKNQRLFTSSLAQYLPDDPNHPEYPELERNYYRYRKSLEARYPQVCEQCAERAEGRIQQAGYTAKTDHLRRMMEKSRVRKTDTGRTTVLDWANSLGRGLWWGGLGMQMLWHVRSVSTLVQHSNEGMYDPDDRSWPTLALSCLSYLVGYLPPADTLMNAAVTVSILSAWWNPQFVQVSRGFTRHLLGFTQWYSFQGLIIFFRFLFRRVVDMDGEKAQSRSAQLSAHLVMSIVMIMIYTLAQKSIRVDTTPLFGTSSTTISPKGRITKKKVKQDSTSLSDLLNEALDSPSPTPQRDRFSQPLINSLPPPKIPDSPPLQFSNLDITPQKPAANVSDEMDWTPTESQVQKQSPHRAFQNMPPADAPRRPFGQTPISSEQSPFWYKVPPAPTNPARQLRNPPRVPVLRSKPARQEGTSPFGLSTGLHTRQSSEESQVSFKEPSFFAPQTSSSNDEANSLADLLGSSFSLGKETTHNLPRGSTQPTTPAKPQAILKTEFTILATLLTIWSLTLLTSTPFSRELQLALLSAAGMIALHTTGETGKRTQDLSPSRAVYIGSALGVFELAGVCWLAWHVWQSTRGADLFGVGVLVVMLGHQVWSSL